MQTLAPGGSTGLFLQIPKGMIFTIGIWSLALRSAIFFDVTPCPMGSRIGRGTVPALHRIIDIAVL